MPSQPLVSVIIPTYNRADLVGRSIESVLDQTYQAIETIVVDDGSTDNTRDVLRRYPAVTVLEQKNAGPSRARNAGIAIANGEIISFLDSDDYWLPTKIERQLDLLNVLGPTVPCCLCNCRVIYAEGGSTSTFDIACLKPRAQAGLWTNPTEVLLNRFVLFNQAAAVRRWALERVGVFNEDLRFGEDYDLPLRLSLLGPWGLIKDELVVYSDASPHSWTQKALKEQVRLNEDLVRMRVDVLALITSDPKHAHLLNQAQCELRRQQRLLLWARLAQRQAAGAAALSRAMYFGERMRRAVLRRSFFHPEPAVHKI